MDSQAPAYRVSSRIVGGRQAVPHSHPWQVLLSGKGKFCGGKKDTYPTRMNIHIDLLATVLNANWIVTAAHCVNGYVSLKVAEQH